MQRADAAPAQAQHEQSDNTKEVQSDSITRTEATDSNVSSIPHSIQSQRDRSDYPEEPPPLPPKQGIIHARDKSLDTALSKDLASAAGTVPEFSQMRIQNPEVLSANSMPTTPWPVNPYPIYKSAPGKDTPTRQDYFSAKPIGVDSGSEYVQTPSGLPDYSRTPGPSRAVGPSTPHSLHSAPRQGTKAFFDLPGQTDKSEFPARVLPNQHHSTTPHELDRSGVPQRPARNAPIHYPRGSLLYHAKPPVIERSTPTTSNPLSNTAFIGPEQSVGSPIRRTVSAASVPNEPSNVRLSPPQRPHIDIPPSAAAMVAQRIPPLDRTQSAEGAIQSIPGDCLELETPSTSTAPISYDPQSGKSQMYIKLPTPTLQLPVKSTPATAGLPGGLYSPLQEAALSLNTPISKSTLESPTPIAESSKPLLTPSSVQPRPPASLPENHTARHSQAPRTVSREAIPPHPSGANDSALPARTENDPSTNPPTGGSVSIDSPKNHPNVSRPGIRPAANSMAIPKPANSLATPANANGFSVSSASMHSRSATSSRSVDQSDAVTTSTFSMDNDISSEEQDADDSSSGNESTGDAEDIEDTAPSAGDPVDASTQDEMLDNSYVNRVPPLPKVPCDIPFKSHVHAGDVFGRMLVTAVQDKVRIITRGEGANGYSDRLLMQGAMHYAALGNPTNLSATSRELRITSLAFCPAISSELVSDASPAAETAAASQPGTFVWYGCANGNLGELNLQTGQLNAIRTNIHKDRICLIQRIGYAMVILDESGKISAWVPRNGKLLTLAQTTPHSQRITMPKHSCATFVGDQLWVCIIAVGSKSNSAQIAHKTLYVRIYNPLADDRPFNALTQPLSMTLSKDDGVGNVTCSTVVPEFPNVVYFGHDSGHISVWTIDEPNFKDLYRVCHQPITAINGLNSMVWVGTRSGHITLYDARLPVWRPTKRWRPHREAVMYMLIDQFGTLSAEGELLVCSIGNDYFAHFWDAFLTDDWIDYELRKALPTFSTPRTLRLLKLTFNIGAASPSKLFGMVDNMEFFQRVLRNSCSFSAPDENHSSEYCDLYSSPDVIVFGFQELIDLEDKRLTAKRLFLGHKRREGKESDINNSSQHKAWHDQLINFVRVVLPPEAPYSVLISESMVGLFSMVFVKTSLMEYTRDATSYQVKTGLGGRYGNKGALVSRFIIHDSSFCFVNCHLAAGQRNVRQRNSDINIILQSNFPATIPRTLELAFVRGGDGSAIADHDVCFIAGDLNYRIDMRRDTAISLIREQNFRELTAADQLVNELQANPMFRLRGFQEAPIHFPPTYKFNKHSYEWDTSEKLRVPAYCDRILWRGFTPETVQCTSYKRWDTTISDHRPVSATFRVKTKLIHPDRLAKALQSAETEFQQLKKRILANTLAYFLSQ
ncbi:hypothetical protein MYAM1_001118 [Malassezia yamatoensis]|uniref:Inositol polyphosphate-related phosphatase domain-containing protein n=1 Tax=Malassezia yamatoensis TaxID=253288 RepID=A0AAJ5YTA9_9BASI|nr:hypothetical protein MYAM1_001118 [Malassezia yamatoensis]